MLNNYEKCGFLIICFSVLIIAIVSIFKLPKDTAYFKECKEALGMSQKEFKESRKLNNLRLK